MCMLSNTSHSVQIWKKYSYHIYCVRSKKKYFATNTSLIFSILMIAVLLVEYYDPQPPTKAHTYSHTSYVTALEVVPLKIYPVLFNLWYKFSCQANPVGTFGFRFVIFSFFCNLLISISHTLITPFNLNNHMLLLWLSMKSTTLPWHHIYILPLSYLYSNSISIANSFALKCSIGQRNSSRNHVRVT